MRDYLTLAVAFAVVLSVIGALLPINGWRARLIHAAFTFAVVVGVALIARETARMEMQERAPPALVGPDAVEDGLPGEAGPEEGS